MKKNRRKKVFLWLTISFVLGMCCLYMRIEYCYYGAFDNLRYLGDGKRIPLWYPYDLVDWGNGVGGVLLGTWTNRCNSVAMNGDASEEEMALGRLTDIVEFGYNGRAIWGRRELRRFKTYLGERYFIFSADMPAPAYYAEREGYVAACQSKGMSPDDLEIFEDRWDDFWHQREPSFMDLISFWWNSRWN